MNCGALADGGGAVQALCSARTYVNSAGVRKGELDPFAVAVMDEIGLDISKHKPMTFEELEDWEGLNFDLIITLVARGAPQGARPRPARWRPTSNTGRRPDPTADRRHAASSGWTPIARCATS